MLEPEPEPYPLRRAFDNAYLSVSQRVWCLSPSQQSGQLLRRVCIMAKSFHMPKRLCAATHARPSM